MFKRIIYNIRKKILTIFGDILVSKFPMFVFYKPTTFKIKGYHTRQIIEAIQPGDILARSYESYIDSYFIPHGVSNCTHTGLYLGNNLVAHCIAEGVVIDDMIDFCRCDRIVLMRPMKQEFIHRVVNFAIQCYDKKVQYDFDFESNNDKYYCHEFTAMCLKKAKINVQKKIGISQFFHLKSPKTYLADSFYLNKNITTVLEF